jgi:hypothetical protein
MEEKTLRQNRHGSATTAHAVRAALLWSQASRAGLTEEFGIIAMAM